MAFIEFGFYIFLACVLAVYYALPLQYRWYALFIASAAFYGYISSWSLPHILMLLVAAVTAYLAGLCLSKSVRGRPLCLVVAAAIIALPLLIIKEAPFFLSRKGIVSASLIFPIGISFYTMQLLAYIIDVYRGKTTPEHNFLKFFLFVSFFPQILQGPIPRYNQLASQLTEGHRFDERTFVKGFMLILYGFFLKLCIADKAGIFVDNVFDNYQAYQGVYVLLAGILYSLQLYTDFLACTTLAQGISELFGIHIVDNFAQPYFATSVKDFWRRWHISLSTWLRDYIYIPLGGNRKGKLRKYMNLLLTFIVSGIWHGAGYKFVFWGILHGIYQIAGDLLQPLKKLVVKKAHLHAHPRFTVFCERIITFFFVMLAWIVFRAERLGIAVSMILSIFTVYNPWVLTNNAIFNLGLSWKEWVILIVCLMILGVVSSQKEKGVQLRDKILSCNLMTRWVIYIGAILFIMIFGTYGFGYDAQAFIYGGF